MSKIESEAFGKIKEIIDNNKCIQIEKILDEYEVTVWENKSKSQHSHYQGASLFEAIMKIRG